MRSRAVLLLPVFAIFVFPAVACGTDTASSTASAVAGTAERRQQAIATFTAEARIAPTATLFPRVISTPVPGETPRPTVELLPATVASVPTLVSRTFSEQQEMDIQALEALLTVRSQAMSKGDFETWYGTCAPAIRDSAIENDALAAQLRAIRFEPDDSVSIQFVLEDVFFSGSTGATVLWGVLSGPSYSSGLGGQYVKEDGKWYSLGWGCAS